jgi:hypothetical protein
MCGANFRKMDFGAALRKILLPLSFLILVAGCATDRHIVYFDVPSHALGQIISRASMARSKGDILEVHGRLVEFQNEHLEYLPDRVSRLIAACSYLYSHNLPGSQLLELSVLPPSESRAVASELPRIPEEGAMKPRTAAITRGRNGPPQDFRSNRDATAATTALRLKSGAERVGSAPLAATPKPAAMLTLSPEAKPKPLRVPPDTPTAQPDTREEKITLSSLGRDLSEKISNFRKTADKGVVNVAVHTLSVRQEGSDKHYSSSLILESEIERSLISSSGVRVVTRRGLKDLQSEKRLGEAEWNASGGSGKKYGVQEADLIVRGHVTVNASGKRLLLNCEMIDTESGVLVASENVTIQPVGGSVNYFLKGGEGR